MLRISYVKTVILALFSLCLVLSIISFPKQAFEASLRGLTIWWDVVFPALLPFFITSELLMGFGVVRFLGVLLEPWMRPLFRLPGAGGFVIAMGLASGYPMGAKLTVRLREEGLITRTEGERLVSIASTSGPLFMFGAVAVGFFQDVRLGVVIVLAHYLSAFLVGLIMRFHAYDDTVTIDPLVKQKNIFYRALLAMHQARLQDKRSFGTLMGEAVLSSIQTLLMIGGFIMMFSVLLTILKIIGIQTLLSSLISIFLSLLGGANELSQPIIAGIFEITLGNQLASEVPDHVPLVHKVAIAGAIIAWSGLSVHAQVISMMAKTDIQYKPYLVARMLHACLAFLCTLFIWEGMQKVFFSEDRPSFATWWVENTSQAWDRYTYILFALPLLFLILLSIAVLLKLAQQRLYR